MIKVQVQLKCLWCGFKAEGWAELDTAIRVGAEMNPIKNLWDEWRCMSDGGDVECGRAICSSPFNRSPQRTSRVEDDEDEPVFPINRHGHVPDTDLPEREWEVWTEALDKQEPLFHGKQRARTFHEAVKLLAEGGPLPLLKDRIALGYRAFPSERLARGITRPRREDFGLPPRK